MIEPFNNVIADCSSKSSAWSVCDWGAGWLYAPDYYPSGEWGFVPGASFNIGDYNNPTMTSLIKATTFGTANLTEYSKYFEQQAAELFQPNAFDPGELADNVGQSSRQHAAAVAEHHAGVLLLQGLVPRQFNIEQRNRAPIGARFSLFVLAIPAREIKKTTANIAPCSPT